LSFHRFKNYSLYKLDSGRIGELQQLLFSVLPYCLISKTITAFVTVILAYACILTRLCSWWGRVTF